jgi:hypothetical protein
MATIGRGAAVVQMLGGKTMKGFKAQAAGAVHPPCCRPTDLFKAVVDWSGAAFTTSAPDGSPCTRMSPTPASRRIAPSGDQFEITFGHQRKAVVVEVGGGLRTYSQTGTTSWTATGRRSGAPRAGDSCSPPVAEPHPGRAVRVRREAPSAVRDGARARQRDPRARPLGGLGRRRAGHQEASPHGARDPPPARLPIHARAQRRVRLSEAASRSVRRRRTSARPVRALRVQGASLPRWERRRSTRSCSGRPVPRARSRRADLRRARSRSTARSDTVAPGRSATRGSTMHLLT